MYDFIVFFFSIYAFMLISVSMFFGFFQYLCFCLFQYLCFCLFLYLWFYSYFSIYVFLLFSVSMFFAYFCIYDFIFISASMFFAFFSIYVFCLFLYLWFYSYFCIYVLCLFQYLCSMLISVSMPEIGIPPQPRSSSHCWYVLVALVMVHVTMERWQNIRSHVHVMSVGKVQINKWKQKDSKCFLIKKQK